VKDKDYIQRVQLLECSNPKLERPSKREIIIEDVIFWISVSMPLLIILIKVLPGFFYF